jgi:predicted nucleotidyltransferase
MDLVLTLENWFIYAHEKNWYLNILPNRDVIEYPIIDEFDYSYKILNEMTRFYFLEGRGP